MRGIYLKIFVPESLRSHGDLLYEWILRQAESMGIHGGTATRAIAGFGRHGHMHSQHFFELAGEAPIILEFFAAEEGIASLLTLLEAENDSLVYIKFQAEAGQTKSAIQ